MEDTAERTLEKFGDAEEKLYEQRLSSMQMADLIAEIRDLMDEADTLDNILNSNPNIEIAEFTGQRLAIIQRKQGMANTVRQNFSWRPSSIPSNGNGNGNHNSQSAITGSELTSVLTGIKDVLETLKKPSKKKDSQPAARRMRSGDFIELYRGWGYDAELNECNDDVELVIKKDGKATRRQVLDDILEKIIRTTVVDYGIDNNAGVSPEHAINSITYWASQNPYHPIRKILDGLVWDNQDHISNFCKYFEEVPFVNPADGTETYLFQKYFRHFVVGAVAKIYGEFQNEMLVWAGNQGSGRSHAVKWLASPLGKYVNKPIDPDSKDDRLRCLDVFIWEVEELGATTRRADVEALKSFLTTATIRERKSYGHRDTIKPSICSFIGTVNPGSGFLADKTGNRRFLVVELKKDGINWNYATEIDPAQIWAQAKAIYDSGVDDWKLSTEDKITRDAQNELWMTPDALEDMVVQIVENSNNYETDYLTIWTVKDRLGCKPTDKSADMTIGNVFRNILGGKPKRNDKTESGVRRTETRWYGLKLKS